MRMEEKGQGFLSISISSGALLPFFFFVFLRGITRAFVLYIHMLFFFYDCADAGGSGS